MRFRAKVEQSGKTATGIEVPADVVKALGSSKKPAVTVTIKGYTYRSTIATMGGRFMLPVSAEIRLKTGVAADDEVEVGVELDEKPREVKVPADLADALAQAPAAQQAFAALSYSNKQRHVLSVEGAKTAPTRQRRIEKVVADLTKP